MPPFAKESMGNVSALTLVTPIRQGFLPHAPIVRYADRLRKVLELTVDLIREGQPTPLSLIQTVHFARWVILDNDRTLLFTSNYDGQLDGYLKAFSVVAAEGLDLVWHNCEGYPGSADFDRFRRWVYDHKVETTAFYSAYPDVTVRDVLWMKEFQGLYQRFVRDLQERPNDFGSLFARLQTEALSLGRSEPLGEPVAAGPFGPVAAGPNDPLAGDRPDGLDDVQQQQQVSPFEPLRPLFTQQEFQAFPGRAAALVMPP
jgi:hypothetical protein